MKIRSFVLMSEYTIKCRLRPRHRKGSNIVVLGGGDALWDY